MRTRRSEQCFGNAKLLLKQGMALPGKYTVSGNVPVIDSLPNKIKLFSGKEWSVKWNAQKASFPLMDVKTEPHPRPAIMTPVMISRMPNILGIVTVSWKSRALESKTSAKARLIKG